MYVLKARYVADSWGLVTKDNALKEFKTEKLAREWGRENLEGARYLASWDAVTKAKAKQEGFDVS